MSIDVQKEIIKKGKESCKHEWIVSQDAKMLTVYPPIQVTEKICKLCGRMIKETARFTDSNTTNEFNDIYNKFHNKKDKK